MVKIEPENLEKTEKLMLDFDQLYLYHFLTQRKSKTCFENLMVCVDFDTKYKNLPYGSVNIIILGIQFLFSNFEKFKKYFPP